MASARRDGGGRARRDKTRPRAAAKAAPLPRRTAKSRSSQAIVEAILSAATELFARGGLARLSTNHIAARAGVSVGSVYQYFPDKESIVAAINLARRKAAAQRTLAALASLEGASESPEEAAHALAAAVERTLRDFVDAGPDDRAIRVAMARHVPMSWIEEGSSAIFDALVPEAAAGLRRALPALGEAEARRRVIVALHAVEGVTLASVLWSNAELGAAEAARELAALVLPYLFRPAP
jgi:AcrR family transcriptional regulator